MLIVAREVLVQGVAAADGENGVTDGELVEPCGKTVARAKIDMSNSHASRSTREPMHARREMLRYLGYRGQAIASDLETRISEVAARCEEIARPMAVWRTFPPEAVRLPGNDIVRHLDGAIEVVLMAVTLGHGVDRELRRLSLTDPLEQVIFDAAATAAVERLADKTEAEIRTEAAERGLFCSWRFSPGYGDLPLDVQPDVLARLNAARFLGITCTPSHLMVPTKSVTAVVGVHAIPQEGVADACDVCNLSAGCERAWTESRCGGGSC